MKPSLAIAAILWTTFGFTQANTPPKRIWHFPPDSKAIRIQYPPKPYKASGLPQGTMSVLTKYVKPGLRVQAPENEDLWEFESVAKLYYHGKLFAIVGAAKGVGANSYLGFVTGIVVYDEDGDGKLESIEDVNSTTGPYVFHGPKWVPR